MYISSPRTSARGFALALLAALLAVTGAPAQQGPTGTRVLTVGDTLVGAVGGVAVDGIGTIYVADFAETVYEVRPDGRTSVFATGLYGASGNAIDPMGNLYQSSFSGNYVTRIDRHGNQEIVATGLQGPVGIAIVEGDLIVCNCRANTLSRVGPDGEVSAFAESPLFNCPNGITSTPSGDLYVANFSDGKVLRVTPDGDVAELATLPGGGNGHVAFTRGSLYATSFQGHRVYRVSLEGDVTLLAGTGARGETDGPALEATFSWPNGIAVSPQGDRLYINDYLNRTPPTVPVPPVPKSILRVVKLASLSDRMAAALGSGGIDAMVEAYRAWKSDTATAGVFTETEVNAYGYALMGGGRLNAALRVFELNAESYPNSWNVWDSLAEAHMNAGDSEKAIELYEKSLEINPANTNATEMLERLRGG